MGIKVASLNMCLGLPNKKILMKELIIENKIDIMCLQETELDPIIDCNLMSFPGFCYESENNDTNARVGCYISNKINYIRRTDLEGLNSHLLIMDIKSEKDLRIINIYRTFNPQNGMSPREMFDNQLKLINDAMTNNTLLLGDLNLDWQKKGHANYAFKNYFEEFDRILEQHNLIQMVNFPTWSRSVLNVHRESTIDHVYAKVPTRITNVNNTMPGFGDHVLISFQYSCSRQENVPFQKRCWRGYNSENLCDLLKNVDWRITDDSVQGYWNSFETKLIDVVDKIAPMKEYCGVTSRKTELPQALKTKFNIRKRLLNKLKTDKSPALKKRIKEIDKELKFFYHKVKVKNVKRIIIPGNSKSLWTAVKAAKDINVSYLPKNMSENGEEIPTKDLPTRVAKFFDNKIRKVMDKIVMEEEVYNGNKRVESSSSFFMSKLEVMECLKTLKNKNSEGYDRIPQRILKDGSDILVAPLSGLFTRIYNQKTIPGQWKISKTIPIFKNKGNNKSIENYRPIANLCSSSKIFEKLILKRILAIEEQNNCDLTGSNQHGFKKGKSTTTLSLTIQSLIARALDEDKFVLMASLDLSSAFDVVNVKLLLKRLKIIGLPADVIELIKVWLTDRFFYVSIDGENSTLFEVLLGTIQGSILGPILYAIFVSPMFELEKLEAFADDNFIARISSNRERLIENMQRSLESLTKWLRQSGLVVNSEKTELCLFHKKDCAPMIIKVGNDQIKSKSFMNVLGITFDSKLQWSNQVSNCVQKANKALCAIRLIRRYFNKSEILQLLTSNFYSILYFNSEVWHIPSLNHVLKQKLLSTSANALKMALNYPQELISFQNLHRMTDRATPEMFSNYKLALLLFKTFNDKFPLQEWTQLNFSIILTTRQSKFAINRNNRLCVGNNAICNRLNVLNDKIPLTWLNKNYSLYKIECKKLFLSFN